MASSPKHIQSVPVVIWHPYGAIRTGGPAEKFRKDIGGGFTDLMHHHHEIQHGICMTDGGGGDNLIGHTDTVRPVPKLCGRPGSRVVGGVPTDI